MTPEKANSRPVVLYFTSDFSMGGTELLLIKILRHLDRERFEPVVACLRKHGPLLKEMAELQVEIHEFNIPQRLAAPFRFWRLVRFMRRRRVSLVHAMLGSVKVYAGLAAWLAGVPVKVCSRLNMGYWAGPIGRSLLRLLFRRVYHRIMVNGRVIKDDLVEHWGIPPDKIEVVYNGIDVDLFSTPVDAVAKKAELGIPADRVIFGTVATLRPIKGLDVLLRATKQVLERCSHAHLAVVGDGPCRDELVKLAASLGISDRITFCGRREDVSEALTTFDVFVLSSLSEGFPNTVCEALVRGLPVVATDVGGVGEAVIPGETGLLVQPGDAAGLAQAMIRLAGDESLRRSMSGKGRELAVDRFSLRHMIGSIEAVYEDELRKLGVPDRSEHSRYAG